MPRAVMIDIETLATSPDAVVCTVGAVYINLDSLEVELPGRRWSLDWADQQRLGRKIGASTVAWWLSQSQAARDDILTMPTPPSDYITVLQEIVEFVGEYPVWSNGADFDCVIMKHLFETYLLKGWNFRQHRCYRTLAALVGDRVPWPDRTGVHHNALDDAIFQAHMLCKFLKVIAPPLPDDRRDWDEADRIEAAQPNAVTKEAMSAAELSQYCPSA